MVRITILLSFICIGFLVSCKDFPLPYPEKDKNFEPTVKIVSPRDGSFIAYKDTIVFILAVNDIDDNKSGLRVNLESNLDGLLFSGEPNKYGQILISGKLNTYSKHRIVLSVINDRGKEFHDEIELNYNIPSKIKILESVQTKEFIKLSWDKTEVPDNNFKCYQVYRSHGDDSTKLELKATLDSKNDTVYTDSDLYIGRSFYQIYAVDRNGGVTKSIIVPIGVDKESYYFEHFDYVRNMVVSTKHNLLFVKTGSDYRDPYYQKIVIIDMSDFSIINTIEFSENLGHFFLSKDEESLIISTGLKLVYYDINSNSILREYTLDTGPNQLVKANENEFVYKSNSGGDYIYYINLETDQKAQVKKNPIPHDYFSFDAVFTYNDELQLLYVFEGTYQYLFKYSNNQFDELFREIAHSLRSGQTFLSSDKSELYYMNKVLSPTDMQLISTLDQEVKTVVNDGEFLVTSDYLIPTPVTGIKYSLPEGQYSPNMAYNKSGDKLFMFEVDQEELHLFDMSFYTNN